MNKTMKKSFLTAFILGSTIAAMPAYAEATLPTAVNGQAVPSLAPMLEKVRPAVVSIAVEGKTKGDSRRSREIPEEFEFFFGPHADLFGNRSSAPRNFRGVGSGAVINAEKGYVITNNHVIDNADKITVKLEDGREFKAKLVGADPFRCGVNSS